MIKSQWGSNDLMVVCAFRYCLGRRTYIVSECVTWLVQEWNNFDDNVKTLIKRELEEAFTQDDEDRIDNRDYKTLGMSCDRDEWAKVRSLWLVTNTPNVKLDGVI